MDNILFWIKFFVVTVVIIYAVGGLVTTFLDERKNLRFIWTVWRGFRIAMFFEALGIIVVVVIAAILVMQVPFLKYGWANAIFTDGGNVVLSPVIAAGSSKHTALRYGAILFLLCLMALLPFFCKLEEECFRRGYTKWGAIVKQSIKFGLVHLVVGIPLGAALALSTTGFWLGCRYRRAYRKNAQSMSEDAATEAAVLVATRYHTMYNTIALLLLFYIVLMAPSH